MTRVRSALIYWLPVALWMVLVFSASSDSGSYQHSSYILEPLVHWFFPHISANAFDIIVTVIRKCAHLTEYALLAFLIWRARRKPVRHDTRPWRWSEAAEAVWVNMLYAATDEFHQTFVPSREGCVRDVMIDSTGAIVGMVALWLIGKLLKYW